MATFTVFAVISFIIGSCGVILNFIVCLAYFINPRLLDSANIFILNISTGDLLYSVVALPMLVTSNVKGEWSFGEAGCTAYGFLTTFFALGSMMHLGGAAYERYVTICKLFDNGEAQFSLKKACFLSTILWCYSFFWSLMPVIGWSSYVPEGIGTSCSIAWRSKEASYISYAFCLTLACFLLPVAVIGFCYFRAYQVVTKLSEQARKNWGEGARVTQETLLAEKKMVRIAVVMTAGFVIAWTPYTVASVVAMFEPSAVSDVGASIPAYIAKSSACYNPFIYAIMYKKLRTAMVRMLSCRRNQVNPGVTTSASRAQTRQKTTSGVPVQRPTTPNGLNATS